MYQSRNYNLNRMIEIIFKMPESESILFELKIFCILYYKNQFQINGQDLN